MSVARLQSLAGRALRRVTPCGEGSLVWHEWLPQRSEAGIAPVVLFHGGSGSWTHWVANIEALLGQGRRVLAPDLPGFGDSSRPPTGEDADAMPAVVEEGLGLLVGGEACDLVAFSFGSMVAALLAQQHPARARRLVVVGSPGLGISRDRVVPLRGWRHLPEGEAQMAVHRHNLRVMMLHHPESITEEALALHAANVGRDRMQRRRLSRTDILVRTLQQVRCPVHAVYGRHDSLYPGVPDEVRAALAQAADFRGLEVIEDCGHWAPYERADAFNALLARLLA